MESILKKIMASWNNASPKKRLTWILLAVGVVCTLLLVLFSNSYEPASISANPVNEIGEPLYYIGAVVKTIGVLLLIIGGAIFLKRMQQKQGKNNSDRAISVAESIRLSPKQAVHLLRVGEKYFLVGATDQNISLLSQVEPFQKDSVTEQTIPAYSQSFESMLADVTELRELKS